MAAWKLFKPVQKVNGSDEIDVIDEIQMLGIRLYPDLQGNKYYNTLEWDDNSDNTVWKVSISSPNCQSGYKNGDRRSYDTPVWGDHCGKIGG